MSPNFNNKPLAIEPNSLILVTGANGFIGSHVADQLLEAGYRVRGTSRDTTKTAWMKELFDKKYGEGRFEAVVVKDMVEPGAFEEACKGVSGVAHVASILSYDPNPNNVIPQVIAGAVNAASAAARQPSIKRFVYTSSSTAITAPRPNKVFTVSTDDWNEEDVKAAWKPPPYEPMRAWAVYGASKTQAEQEMWKFAREKKPGFIMNAVLPNANFGVILSDKQPASTGEWPKKLYHGDIELLKTIPPQWMVNVQDTARLHVAALVDPDVRNERILAYAYPFNWNDVLACLRKIKPEKKFPNDFPNNDKDLSKVNNSRGAELLKAFGREGWTGLEESVRENVEGL